MPRFPSVWNWPNTPEHKGATLPADVPASASPDVKDWFESLKRSETENSDWVSKVQSWMKQLLVVLQLITSALAVKLNNELMSLAGTNNVTGVLNLTNATQFRIPQVAGDYAVPNVAEMWYNTTLHRIRFDTDNVGLQSLPWFRPLAQNFALGTGVASLAVTLTPNEADTNYQLLVETTWGTNWSLGATKAIGGFTITFGTATPDANQKITYSLLR